MSLNNTLALTEWYGNCFVDCIKLAVWPYSRALTIWAEDRKNPRSNELLVGAAICVVLTVVVPILPTFMSITLAIAGFLAALLMASMIVGYPFALLCDALETCVIEPPSHDYGAA